MPSVPYRTGAREPQERHKAPDQIAYQAPSPPALRCGGVVLYRLSHPWRRVWRHEVPRRRCSERPGAWTPPQEGDDMTMEEAQELLQAVDPADLGGPPAKVPVPALLVLADRWEGEGADGPTQAAHVADLRALCEQAERDDEVAYFDRMEARDREWAAGGTQ